MSNVDRPPNKVIAGYLLGGVVVLIITVIGVKQLFDLEVRGEFERKVLSRRDPRLTELRIREEARLTQYAWVNQAQGRVRIPVERAMELTLRDWSSRSDQPVPIAGAPVAPVPVPVDGVLVPVDGVLVPVDGVLVPVDGVLPVPVPAPIPAPVPAPVPAPAGTTP